MVDYFRDDDILNHMVEYSSKQLDKVFHALSDATRRKMLKQLTERESSITELAAPHRMSFAAVSKHLKVLEDASFISRTKDGRIYRCRANLTPLQDVTALLEDLGSFWRSKLDNLDKFLSQEKPLGAKNNERKRKK